MFHWNYTGVKASCQAKIRFFINRAGKSAIRESYCRKMRYRMSPAGFTCHSCVMNAMTEYDGENYLRQFGIIRYMRKKNEEQKNDGKRVVIYNRKARHEYSIEETFEAGLVLVGTEVKSIRTGQASIQEAFCKVENNEVWLYQMHIAPYDRGTHWNVEPKRKRKLLLHRNEIRVIQIKMEQKGLALIPLSLYFQHGYAKLEIGLARGKKLYDKREDIAKRDLERERQRESSPKDM